MPVPAYYGDPHIVVKVNPDHLFFMAESVMPEYALEVADSVNRIIDVWNGLKLGWVGGTADEAQAFNDAWSAAVSKLFGTQDDPTTGILHQIGRSVALASMNYGEAESVVTKMFRDMSNALGQSASGGDSSRNIDDGPITENT
jgi:hypothetical protein